MKKNNPHNVWKPRTSLPARMRKKQVVLDAARPMADSLTWFVIETAPGREHAVAASLETIGSTTMVPLKERWRLAKRKVEASAVFNMAKATRRARPATARVRVKVFHPAIPRAVFVGFAVAPPWYAIRETRHVTGVLGIAGCPLALRHGEAERFRDNVAHRNKTPPARTLRPGNKVTFDAGDLFAGKVVEITALHGKWATIAGLFDIPTDVDVGRLRNAA